MTGFAPTAAQTPRTDAAVSSRMRVSGVSADFTRTLERELIAAKPESEEPTCEVCNWTNTGCLKVQGEWTCHGCIDRGFAQLSTIEAVLANLMPFVLEDYHPNCATLEFRSAVEAALSATGQKFRPLSPAFPAAPVPHDPACLGCPDCRGINEDIPPEY